MNTEEKSNKEDTKKLTTSTINIKEKTKLYFFISIVHILIAYTDSLLMF